MRARRYGLYEAQGLDLEAIAQRAENNPLNEPEYYVVGLEPTLLVRANHVPYQMFLEELNLGTDNGLYPFNYEPNYLEVLMIAHLNVLERAKQRWLDLLPEQREIQNLIYTGSPG
jgi:hypothetical protein